MMETEIAKRLKKLCMAEPTHRGLREGVQTLIEELEASASAPPGSDSAGGDGCPVREWDAP